MDQIVKDRSKIHRKRHHSVNDNECKITYIRALPYTINARRISLVHAAVSDCSAPSQPERRNMNVLHRVNYNLLVSVSFSNNNEF